MSAIRRFWAARMSPIVADSGVTPPPAYGTLGDTGAVCDVATISGPVYYIDPDGGSDAANGLSAATPWRTMANVYPKIINGGTLVADTAFLVKRGTTAPLLGCWWIIPRVKCTIDSYGTGARPVIQFADTHPTGRGSGVIGRTISGTAVDGFVVRNVEVLGPGSGAGLVDFGGVTPMGAMGIVVENVKITNCPGNGILLNMLGGDGALIRSNWIEDCCSVQSNGGGLDGGNGTGVVVERNTFLNNGTGASSITSHNSYLNDTSGLIYRYNHAYMTRAAGSYGLVMHGTFDDVHITDNLFDGNGNGVSIGPAYSVVEVETNVYIERNIVRNSGTMPGHTQGSGIDSLGVQGIYIRNNLVYGNLNGGIQIAALAPNAVAGEIPAADVHIEYNTVVFGGTRSSPCVNLLGVSQWGGQSYVRGNLLVNESSSNSSPCLSVSDALPSVQFGSNSYSKAAFTTRVVTVGATYNQPLSYWQALASGEAGAISTAPAFADEAGGDYRLTTAMRAPLAYAGALDFTGATRPASSNLGAYEALA